MRSYNSLRNAGAGRLEHRLSKFLNPFRMVVVFTMVLALSACGSTEPEPRSQSSKPAETSQGQAPAETDAISAFECAKIERGVTVIETLFDEGTATAGQSMAVLEATANDWEDVAKNYSGSKADWLNKMAELSRGLSTFINNGSGDGALLLDQLYANMRLASQFC
jgi:hypothetical protein